MAAQWKINTDNLLGVDLGPYDIYGASGFKLYYKHTTAPNPVDSNAVFTEAILDIAAPISLTVSGLVPVGSTSITVTSTVGVEAGQVYQNGLQYVYVKEVVGNVINLRRPTTIEIADAATLTQQGNTGLYETTLNLSTLGQYSIIISNPSIGLLNEITKVEVVTNLTDDVYNKVNAESVGINTKLDSISSAVGSVDTGLSGRLIV